jgi:diadenosine tetraphosphate (Ap4A) HIT family hydrolase
MDKPQWELLVSGAGCQMDAPRPASNDFSDLVAALSVSSLYLAKNQTYRGQCSLIFDLRHAARPDQLTADEWAAFCADLYVAQRAVVSVTRPDHVNIESLGNVVPHLHWHIIPRYVGDPRWGMPIWTTPLSAMADTRLEANEHIALVQQLQAAIR